MSEEQIRHLKAQLVEFYQGSAAELLQSWSGYQMDATDGERWASVAWRQLTEIARLSADDFFHGTRSATSIPFDEVLQSHRFIDHMAFRANDDSRSVDPFDDAPAIPSEWIDVQPAGNSVDGIISRSTIDNKTQVPIRFIFRSVRHDWQMAGWNDRWQPLSEILMDRFRDQHLAIVVFPWTPRLSRLMELDTRASSHLEGRRKKGLSTCFVSFSAWGLAFKALSRQFIGTEAFDRLWRPNAPRLIQVRDVARAMEQDQQHAGNVHEVLWEAVFAMSEVG